MRLYAAVFFNASFQSDLRRGNNFGMKFVAYICRIWCYIILSNRLLQLNSQFSSTNPCVSSIFVWTRLFN
jgi:hypothetical protein